MKKHLGLFNSCRLRSKSLALMFIATGLLLFGQIAVAATILVSADEFWLGNTFYDACPEDPETHIKICDDDRVQDAVVYASKDDTIEIDRGTYIERISIPTEKNLTIKSINPETDRDLTILDGDGDGINPGRVITITDALSNSEGYVDLIGLTIRNGKVEGSDGGGGIYVNGFRTYVHVNIDNCVIRDNKSTGTGGGGGLLFASPNQLSTCKLSNCIIRNNSTNYVAGGAWLYGGSFTIKNCDIFDNIATSTGGGTLMGGGLHLVPSYGPNKIAKTMIHGNTIYRDINGVKTLSGTGGGVSFRTSWDVIFDGCEIYDNKSSWASAVYFEGSPAYKSQTYFVDTRIRDNEADPATITGDVGRTVHANIGAFINCQFSGNTNGSIKAVKFLPTVWPIVLYNTFVTDQLLAGVMPGDDCTNGTPDIIDQCENPPTSIMVHAPGTTLIETQQANLQVAMDKDFDDCPRPYNGLSDAGVIEVQPHPTIDVYGDPICVRPGDEL